MKSLALLGASGHGKVVADIAEQLGYQTIHFYDDAHPSITKLEVWDVVGTTKDLLENSHEYDGCCITIGANRIREQKYQQLKQANMVFPTLIHPSAVVSRHATVHEGSVVMANAVINIAAKVGVGCIVNTGATIDHDCKIDNFVHISPSAALAGNVSIGDYSWVGIGAAVKQGVTIASNVMVGAGASVITNINTNETVVGVPAKTKTSTVLGNNHA